MAGLAVLSAVLLAYALLSRRLAALLVTAPILFVAAGMAVGPHALGVIDLDLTQGTPLHVAELALALLLFSDAAQIDLRTLRGERSLPGRLLAIGMPATIALGTAAGALILTDLDVWEAAIVAAVLAPTDAALGQAVVSSRLVPERIRQGLTVESGLNDGLTVPFLALFLAIAAEETVPEARDWLGFAVEQIGLGVALGVLVGGGGAWLVQRALASGSMGEPFEQAALLALAVLAFVVADEAGGNGFIAAFVAGLAAGRLASAGEERAFELTERQGQLLGLAVLFAFGAASLGFLDDVDWRTALYAVMSLTLVRMVPAALAVTGTGFRPPSVAFIGWFGPRGLASIVLALVVAAEQPDLPALDSIMAVVTLTVLASIVLHGLTAQPLVRAHARATGAPD
jgi:sodium/hydrogen antiporter